MKLAQQIALLAVLSAAVPLATAGFLLIRLNEEALEREVKARFDETARHAAEAVASEIDGKAHLVARTVETIPWEKLDPDEARGALVLLAGQVGGNAAALFAAGSSAPLATWTTTGGSIEPLVSRAPIARALLERRGSVVLSAVYADRADGAHASAAMAVPVATPGANQRVAVVQLPLDGIGSRLDAVRGGSALRIVVVESDGKVVASSPRELGVGTEPTGEAGSAIAPVLKDLLRGGPHDARRFADGEDGHRVVLGAHAAVGDLGWGVIVEEDAAQALAAPRVMRRLTLGGSAIAGALALGIALAFSRRLTRALERLTEGTQAMARGDLDHRVGPIGLFGGGGVFLFGAPIGGTDEVAVLARTFDAMGSRLAESRAELDRWNRELEARVAARTAELAEAQAQLLETQKLAALGQLGAGVAHEINNPLGAVLGQVQLLLSRRPVGDPEREGLLRIEEQTRRATVVVRNLLAFSERQPTAVVEEVGLNRLALEALSLIETHVRDKGVRLELALDPSEPKVKGDPRQLAQVLLNLVTNARTATPAGGRITVRTLAHVEGAEPNLALLAVEDTGKGIQPEHRERLFEPFFTTKDEWSNVGLGLSVSFRIVSDHGGRIAVESAPGRGAAFGVFLPAIRAEAVAP